jgi:CHAT domain-containing protein
MLFKLWAIILVFVLPLLALAQSTERQIKTERELVSALCRMPQDQPSRELLLKSHSQLVDSQLWRDLNDRAAAAYYGQSPQESLAIYEVAIQVAAHLRDQKLLAVTYYSIGRTYSGLNEIPKAIEAYEKSRGYFEQAGLQRDLIYILSDLGAFYLILEDYSKAIDYSEQSITLAEKLKSSDALPGAWPDDYGRARALQTFADIDLRDGNHTQAIEKLQTSLALYQKLSSERSSYNFYIAGDLMALGRVYTAAGDNARALLSLNKALEIVKTLGDPDTMSSLLNSIGVLYTEQEDYAQAKSQFNQSLKIYIAESNQEEIARVLLNLGVVEQREANYDEALALFKLSLQKAKAAQTVDGQIAANEGIGVVLTAKKDFPAALQVLDQSIDLNKDKKDKTRQTELLWRSAQVRYEMRDYARSSELAQDALNLARAAHLPKLTYLSTTTLGQSYAAQDKIELATQTLIDAVDQAEAMRYQVAGREVERQLFFENKVSSYNSLIDLLLKQGRLVDAFLYAERAKGRVLLDVLNGDEVDLAKALTTSEKKESERLNRRISEINDLISTKEANSTLAATTSLYTKLDAARLDYRSFEDALYASHPELRVRSGRTAALTTADMNSLNLDRDCAYLEYVVSKDGVRLFVLTIDQADGAPNLQAYPLAIRPDELTAKVNQFHDRLANRHPDYAAASQELYSLLVKPASGQIANKGTICIIPDGVLWNLPFQALMSSGDHYLLEDRALYYAPSLSVLREMAKERGGKEKSAASLIAFGNPVIGKDAQRNEELCPLPESETEVTSIAESFGPRGSKVLIGRDASEKTFKALTPTYSVIHLATHGVIDNKQPLYSHLLLTKTEGDPENDGLLEAREIMDMNLHADLVVLSACETANGKISPGEGVIGMSWAFFFAGTRSMVVSQWKVNSASTSELMTAFYENFHSDKNEANKSQAQAIRRAALTLLKDDRYHHPFYWAGFTMIGRGM